MTTDILKQLFEILEARKNATPDSSYVASLYAQGQEAILKKIGEEATEVIIAANTQQKDAIIHETADLWFHTLNLSVDLVNQVSRKKRVEILKIEC